MQVSTRRRKRVPELDRCEGAKRFASLAEQLERMEQRHLLKDEQRAFARQALRLRFPEPPAESRMQPAQLLTSGAANKRAQEHVLRGGLTRWSINGRLTRTRPIDSIRRDVALNGYSWPMPEPT